MGSDVMLQDGVSMRIELKKRPHSGNLLHLIPLQPFNVLPGQRGIEHGLDVLDERGAGGRFILGGWFLLIVAEIGHSIAREMLTDCDWLLAIDSSYFGMVKVPRSLARRLPRTTVSTVTTKALNPAASARRIRSMVACLKWNKATEA
jgi:hypothetical protein